MSDQPFALLLAGPTASGKSALALALAERLGGTVINADSMQVYDGLRVLTARPSEEEEGRVPHRLYGVHPPDRAASVAWWRGRALEEMAAARLPILCGGTGLYFRALTEGLSEIPAVPPEAREEARGLLAAEGPAALHVRLTQADPETAARLRPSDSQRLARAWEVWRGTGRGLASWQREEGTGPARRNGVPWRFAAIRLDPPRDALRAAIGARWQAMIDAGAVEEVRALVARGLDPALPAMRAHGVPEISAVLRGEIPIEEAGRRACLAIGQYTKRQATWFRHHPLADVSHTHTIHARVAGLEQFSESEQSQIFTFIDCCR
ncbi:tRNA (adenosine(37)-N6)-dimethylallyltransferase MiaA [Roseomonas marmotae]|uniref:tRNA dimethylallyltransferase n=1 Tax=Roseomonas marmotae TaxID=2768161 RepID=A0ABS3KH39_9PROT|nr:tRNA (adenosine(37)-N6)-dimethylallyltransferase MiaA [Roseomonas marmotae]MBO1076250.1 tRNA (adenosine(37)-N6)-dimethylallyltransferase MiaA [Roseomonas marmotae]QTI77867.1 tRNA (adenosine(37)-N6)-dimethylallyltransferase MiaA [Roseomonas marmotae]